jgi:Spy/CpxP family protein refolding chaperone
MKKLLFICTLSLGLVFNSNAQRGQNSEAPNRTPEALAERMSSRMAEALELSDTQKKEIYDIQLQQLQERMANRDEMSQERKASMTKHQEKIAEVLTPEQQQKWEEMRQEEQGRRGNMRDSRKENPEGPSNRGRRQGRNGGPHSTSPN